MAITLVVDTTADQNDGGADNGLSLRDALIIANSDPGTNDYEIILMGGATLTHALLDGSPAIDAGNNANAAANSSDIDDDGDTTELIPFDQRGSGFLPCC